MKIGVNARVLIAQRMEGVARFIYETLKCMVKAHPEHEFHFYFDRPYDDLFLFADNVIPHVEFPPARHPVLWYLWFEHSLPKAMKRDGIDVCYSGDTFMSLKTNVPTLLVSHDINYHHYPEHIIWSHKKFYQHYFPRYHKKAKHIIAVSDATKQDIIQVYGLPESKVSVAYNAVPEGFKPIAEEEVKRVREKYTQGKPYFIYLGSLHPRKNVDKLILGYSSFREKYASDIGMVIYGRKAWKSEAIFEAYENSPFKSDIQFMDNSEGSIHQLMGAALGLCYVSLHEGFGIPILEAFSAGIPVITSNRSSMPEVAGDAALLADPESVESISDQMNRMATDETLRNELVKKGFERLKRFSWEESANIIFEKLLTVSN